MITLLVSLLVDDIISGDFECPDSSLIKPCFCIYDSINCGGNHDIDLVKIFETLSKHLTETKSGKRFNGFHLNNTFITELKENTFSDITFGGINIENCHSLRSIHENAFSKADLVVENFNLVNNTMLSWKNTSIFKILSKFHQIQTIELSYNNNIHEIPPNAFENNLAKLEQLLIFKPGSLTKLGGHAFSKLTALRMLHILQTSIDLIPERAFEFNEVSKQSLTLYLGFNKLLNSSRFARHSLERFKRPTKIQFIYAGDSIFGYLDEKIFQPFLKANPENQIASYIGFLDCNDCRNSWLKKNHELIKQVIHLPCTNQKKINDSSSFANCQGK